MIHSLLDHRRSPWLGCWDSQARWSAFCQPPNSYTTSWDSTGSILVTTNLPFDEWTEVFGSERLTGALLDRLTHHVHILEMNGESYRLKGSRQSVAAPSSAPDRADAV